MRHKHLLLTGLILLSAFSREATGQSVTLQGFVTDMSSGAALPGATVLLTPLDADPGVSVELGLATDVDGVYVVAGFALGRYQLRVSYVGFTSVVDTLVFDVGGNRVRNVALTPSDESLGEVVVSGERSTGAARVSAGHHTITPAEIERVPTPDVGGDLASYLTMVPGIVSVGESGGQLFIRGGEPGQNLVLIDGIPLYQPFHILGFYSAFPSEIISQVDIYAGGFGVQYGGHLSSVLDVSTRRGNMRQFQGSVSVSPFVSGVRVDIPVIRDRISLLTSARISVIEQGAARIVNHDLPYHFGDLFGKLHAQLSANTQLSVTGVHTFDRGTLREATPQVPDVPEIRWKNTALGGRFLFLPGSLPLRGEVVVSISNLRAEQGPAERSNQVSDITRYSGQMDMIQYWRTVEVRLGLFVGTTQITNDLPLAGFHDFVNLTDAGLYVQPEFRIGRGASLAPGIRIHTFPSLEQTFVEPRVRAMWDIGKHHFSAAGGIYHQEVVGVSDRRDATGVFTAWTPTPTRRIESAVHALAGYRTTLWPSVEVSVEAFYKRLSDLSVAEWTAYPRFTTNLQPADGVASGLDIRVEGRRGPLYGLVSYGLSRVEYNAQQAQLPVWYGVETLNYRPAHDRRHQLNALVSATVAGIDVSVRWQFGSGLPYSRAFGFDRFILLDGGVDVFENPADDRVIYERPFNGTLPAYHRLDVSVERSFDLNGVVLTVQGGVINGYDRSNVFYYDVFTLQRVDQLPIIPFLGVKVGTR